MRNLSEFQSVLKRIADLIADYEICVVHRVESYGFELGRVNFSVCQNALIHAYVDDPSAHDFAVITYKFALESKRKLVDDRRIDALIERMHLTQGEYDVLCAYMSGLTYLEVTQLLDVNRTTIWRRRMKLQDKFEIIEYVNDLFPIKSFYQLFSQL